MNIDYPNGMKAAELYICDGDIKEYNTNFYCINFFLKNQKGYRNLCKLVSIAMTKGYIIKPRINHNILEQYKEGLICLSGVNGEIAKRLSDGDKNGAKEIAEYYKNLFGEDFSVSLQETNAQLSELAKELNIKTITTTDEIVDKCDFDFDSIKVSDNVNSNMIKEIVFWANEHEIKTGKVNDTLPDLSIEIDESRCEQVIDEYLIPKYGSDCVAKVETPDKNAISILITTTPIDEIIPVKMSPDGNLVTLYSKETIEKMGLHVINFMLKSF